MLRLILICALLLPVAGAAKTPETQTEITLTFSAVVKASAPSVVNIYARKVVQSGRNPFQDDPFFNDFFRQFKGTAPQVQNSLGSGVVLSADGLVVSNYHVVGGMTDIRVVLNDRREFAANVVIADEQSDLAVLRLEGASGLPAITLSPSEEVEVGDLVLAIGNPFGVGQTVSSGIVSGLARSGGAVGNARAYFVQTDAPINPGNSGGALVDVTGRLVGINTSILTRSGGSNGIGFAIPADLVAAILKQARAGHLEFQRPWAGMAGQSVDGGMAEGLGLDLASGTIVTQLHADSPFAEAGLGVGDVILTFNGQEVNGPAEMLYRMTVAGPGTKAKVTYLQNGDRKSAEVALFTAPELPARNQTQIDANGPLQGLLVARINPAVITELDLPMGAEGVVVTGVGGFARRLGFQSGDILVSVNRRKIETVRDVMRAAGQNTRNWSLEIQRGGQVLTMRFQT